MTPRHWGGAALYEPARIPISATPYQRRSPCVGAEVAPRPALQGPDGVDAAAHERGDGGVGLPVEVEQLDGAALVGCQPGQGVGELDPAEGRRCAGEPGAVGAGAVLVDGV